MNYLVGVIALMVIGIAIVAVIQSRKQREILAKNPGFPKGHFMSKGMGIGIAIGAGLGVAMGNIAIGVGVGVAIGAGIGSSLEQKHKDELRPLTEEEKQLKKQSMIYSIATLAAGVIVFLLIYFLK